VNTAPGQEVSAATPREWGSAVALAGALTLFLLLQTPATTLWDRDEPRFAQAAVEMLASGRYLVPTFNEELRPQKPILVYWLMTASLRLFGRTEFAVRCWSPIGMGIAALATFAIGRRLWSARVGLLAMPMLVLNPLALLEGQAATTDAVLLACTTVSLAIIIGAMDSPPRWTVALTLGAALGAGLLTKGPVGLAVPLAIAAAAGWLTRRQAASPWRFTVVLTAAALIGIALFAAWMIPASAASDGRLATEGLLRENLLRALVPMEGHGEARLIGLLYYPLVVIVGFAPWTLYLPAIVVRARRAAPWTSRREAIVTAWIAVPLIAFTVVATKLPHYILPIWPALALAGARIADADSNAGALDASAWVGLVILAILVALDADGLVVIGRSGLIDGLAPAAVVSAALLVAGFAPAIYAYARGRRASAIFLMMASFVVNTAWVAFAVAPAIDRAKIVPVLADAIRRSSAPVFAYGFAEPSLVFYGGRPVSELVGSQALVAWAHQQGDALLIAPRASIADVEHLHGTLGLREVASRQGWNYPKGARLEVVAFVRPAVR